MSSCSTTKYVPDNQYLLTKNTIYIDSAKVNNNELNEYLIQKPNAKAIGVPLSLYFYNLGNPRASKDVSEWKENHPKWYNLFKDIFSEKQSIGVAQTFIGINEWFLNSGQAPVTINDKKTKKSVANLKTYFQNRGYFKSTVSFKNDTISKKKGTVSYFINRGKPLFLDSISKNIQSPILDSLYKKIAHKSFLNSGDQYNNQSFINEAERITKHFRNNGVYNFNINSIGFYDIDTIQYKTNVQLKIDDRVVEKDGSYTTKPYQIQKIKNINVITDYSYNKKDLQILDSINYKSINFKSFGKLKYNPKYLYQSLFIKPNQIYTDSLLTLTRTHLRGLKNFKTTSIRYRELSDEELEANILLTPTEKYTLGIETELSRSNIRNFDISAKFSITNRNTFKGAEIFQLSFTGGYFNSTAGNGWEVGTDLSLEVPRFMAPFGWNKFIPKSMFPRTKFYSGVSIQRNIGLDRQNISLGIDYRWQFTPRKTIQIELFNTQYVRNLNTNNYFVIYNSEYNELREIANSPNSTATLPENSINNFSGIVKFMTDTRSDANFSETNPAEYQENSNILNRYNIITSDFLIPVIAYNFTYNNRESFKDQNFSFFKIRVANSGNVMGLLSEQTNNLGKKTVFQIPIAQYLKTDLEYKKFWRLSETSILGLRTFAGAIITYGESEIPFSRSYFAGGANDIRAWRTYDLGPGRRPPGLEFNIGSLKLLGSLEYRFDIIRSFKGALFIDGGNIWDITNSSLVDDTERFKNLQSFTDVAIGTGFGIRYDFKFLVARLDLGFKIREPYLNDRRWFQNSNLKNAVFNIGINYPF